MKELKGIDENTVIHCETLELWNLVIKLSELYWLFPESWENYKEKSCISIGPKDMGFCDLFYFQRLDKKIITAAEFIRMNTQYTTFVKKVEEREIIGYEAPFDNDEFKTFKVLSVDEDSCQLSNGYYYSFLDIRIEA